MKDVSVRSAKRRWMLVAGLCAALSTVVVSGIVRSRSEPMENVSGVLLDGPIESFVDGGTGQQGRVSADDVWTDWAGIEMVNRAPDEVVIEKVELVPGLGSDHLLPTDGFFILGLSRSFGGGMADAPSGRNYWGVKPKPAVGYRVPGTSQDKDRIGVALMVRLGLDGLQDGSFRGVDVYYTWHGDEYKAFFNQGMTMCRTYDDKPVPKLCRGPAPAPGGTTWPDEHWH